MFLGHRGICCSGRSFCYPNIITHLSPHHKITNNYQDNGLKSQDNGFKIQVTRWLKCDLEIVGLNMAALRFHYNTPHPCAVHHHKHYICVSHLFVGDIDRSAEDDPLHHLAAGRCGQRAGVAVVASQWGWQQVLQHKRLQDSLFFYMREGRRECSDRYNMIYTTLLISLQTMVIRLSGADPSATVSQPLSLCYWFHLHCACLVQCPPIDKHNCIKHL